MTVATPTTPFTGDHPIAHTEPGSVPPGKLWGLMAEYDSPAEIYEAATKVRDAGYRWWDCYVPFPVHGLDQAMGLRPTWLPILVFLCGLTGCIVGAVLQWFTNATSFDMWALVPVRGYDFIISGKPMASIPTWIIVMFELTILLAAFGAVFGMLIMNGLPRWYHPCFKSPNFHRVTNDRFFLVIESRDPRFVRSRAREFMESLEPLSIEELEI